MLQYNGWLEEGAELMGLLPLADKYNIQVVNSNSLFCTLVGWRREQISWNFSHWRTSITSSKSIVTLVSVQRLAGGGSRAHGTSPAGRQVSHPSSQYSSLFCTTVGWRRDPLADKYNIQVVNSNSLFCTTVGWRREQSS